MWQLVALRCPYRCRVVDTQDIAIWKTPKICRIVAVAETLARCCVIIAKRKNTACPALSVYIFTYLHKSKSIFLYLKNFTVTGRYEYGEMNITKLNQRIDDIEDEIYREKLKIKKCADELGDTFDDMLSNYWSNQWGFFLQEIYTFTRCFYSTPLLLCLLSHV